MKRNLLCLVALLVFPLAAFGQGEWEARNNGLDNRQVYALCVSPANNRVIFAGTEAGLFRSQDCGENWALVQGGLPVHSIWVSDDGRTVMIARGWGSRSDGLWRSQNGGEFDVVTWVMYPTALAVNPDDNNQIFLGTDRNGVYFTLNGNDWNQANNGLGGGSITQLSVKTVGEDTFIFAATASGLYMSEVGNNLQWREVGPHGLPVRQFAFSFRDEETVFAGTHNETDSDGLYVSNNMGGDWEPLYWCFYVEAVEDFLGALVFASSEVGVQLIIEGGEDWMELNDNLPEETVTDLLGALDPDAEEMALYCSTNGGGIYRFVPTVDRPPSAFGLSRPAHEAWVNPGVINFRWGESRDPDGDEVSYQFSMSWEEEEVGFVVDTIRVNVDPEEYNLPTNTPITWSVTAMAGGLETPCNAPYVFFRRDQNDRPPNDFSLLSPVDSAAVNFAPMTFICEEAVDPDGDAVTYEGHLVLPNAEIWMITIVGPSIEFDPTDEDLHVPRGQWLPWWVIAKSGSQPTLNTHSRETFQILFRPEDIPPSEFELMTPANGARIEDPTVTFIWERSIDPDPWDEVVYEFVIQGDGQSQLYDLLADTVLTLDRAVLPWDLETTANLTWSVRATANGVAVNCDEDFTLTLLPLSAPEADVNAPHEFALLAAYPNPFNSVTTIRYTLPAAMTATLAIYNSAGQMVDRLAEGFQPPGLHEVVWQAEGFPAGVYYAALESGGRKAMVKVTMVK